MFVTHPSSFADPEFYEMIHSKGGVCKHCAGLIVFVNTHRDETQTDESCGFIEPSKLAKSRYPRGEELENFEPIPEKLKMARLTFEMISDSEKEYLANLMEEFGNTSSPFYTILSSTWPSTDSVPENYDDVLPDWVKTHIFAPTNDNDIPFRVIT